MKYYTDDCVNVFSPIGYTTDLLRPRWAMINYGFKYPTATNLVFTNGDGDPWSGGAYRLTTTNVGSIYSYIIKDGAHVYDLRRTYPEDIQSVKYVRSRERYEIKLDDKK